MPGPLRLAVIAHHHFDVVRLPAIPHVLQKLALAPGALLGRAVGYAPTYEAVSGAPATAVVDAGPTSTIRPLFTTTAASTFTEPERTSISLPQRTTVGSAERIAASIPKDKRSL